jgi:hypothetical protein
MAKIEVNKISKIYNQNSDSPYQFDSIDQAKKFFLTTLALELFDRYCFRQKWQITNNNKSLHWTISFQLDLNPDDVNYVPFSDLWRDNKQTLTDKDAWFVHPNHPVINHGVNDLF